MAKSVKKKINQGLVGESSEWREGRKDKRSVRGDKSDVNVNGKSKQDLSDNNAVLNVILKAG